MTISLTLDEVVVLMKDYLAAFPIKGHVVKDIELNGYGASKMFVVSFDVVSDAFPNEKE